MIDCDTKRLWLRVGPGLRTRFAASLKKAFAPLICPGYTCRAMQQLEHGLAILLYLIVFGSPIWIPIAVYAEPPPLPSLAPMAEGGRWLLLTLVDVLDRSA
jgi:hypothetical protein